MKRTIAVFLFITYIFLLFPTCSNANEIFPSAENVMIEGVAYAGGKIVGKYDYIGIENVVQGESRFQWLVSDMPDEGFAPLEGENNIELLVNEKLLGKYIKFEVTPVGEDGTEGLPVLSESVLEQSIPESYFDESFIELDTDISDGDGWVLTTTGGTVELNNACLEFVTNGTTGSTVGAERRFAPLNGIFTLDFTITMSAKQPTNFIYAYEAGTYVFNVTADANNIGVYVGNGGFDSARWEILLSGYQVDTPYNIKVLVNTDTDRLSVAIDNEWKLENAFLRKDVTVGVDKFYTLLPSNEIRTLSISKYTVTKYIKSPDLESVLSDAKLLNLDIENGIENDLTLPDLGENGSTIRWESSNPEVISNEGVVTQSLESDTDVTLTAYLKKGKSPEIAVEFNVKVLQFIMPAPIERINNSLLAIELPEDAIKEDLTLNTQGDFDVIIQWTSSNEEIISTEGKVNRPLRDKYVTLTAVAMADGECAERSFTILVKGTDSSSGASSGGSGSGGGRVSSSKKKVVNVPSVELLPEKTPTVEPTIFYTDIKDFEWAEEAIMYLTVKGFVKGTGESAFEPRRYIKREEFVHMLVNSFELKGGDGTQKFNDVDENAWYTKSILAARNVGLVMGKEDNTFGVGEQITRQDAVVMLYRMLEMRDVDMYVGQDNSFDDNVDIASYAKQAVDVLWTNDIIRGNDDGNFYPNNNMTRAEACKLLYEAMLILERS